MQNLLPLPPLIYSIILLPIEKHKGNELSIKCSIHSMYVSLRSCKSIKIFRVDVEITGSRDLSTRINSIQNPPGRALVENRFHQSESHRVFAVCSFSCLFPSRHSHLRDRRNFSIATSRSHLLVTFPRQFDSRYLSFSLRMTIDDRAFFRLYLPRVNRANLRRRDWFFARYAIHVSASSREIAIYSAWGTVKRTTRSK